MKCPKCGHENLPTATLCAKCQGVRFVRAGGAAPPAKPKPQVAPLPPPAPVGPRHFLAPAGAPPLFLTPGKVFTIGRAPDCSFSVPSKRVSRLHAEITWENDRPVIVDKDSSNGVFVNGNRVKTVALQPGDELEIGPFLCVYRHGDPSALKADSAEVSKTMADKGDVLGGQISDVGLAEVLQGLEFNAKTGTLNVFSRETSGWMTISSGSPGAAEANDKRDEEAVIELLMLKQGRFTFVSELRVPEKRIRATVTAMLLEWGRRADERATRAAEAAAAASPPPDVVDTPTEAPTDAGGDSATAVFKHVDPAEAGVDLGATREGDSDETGPTAGPPPGDPAPAADGSPGPKGSGFDFPG